MSHKKIKRTEYQKIPVSPDVYAQVRLVADLNERSMGGQVAAWVRREVPECSHKKQGVNIEYAPTVDTLGEHSNTGWYCPTCKRVYVNPLSPPAPFALSGISPKSKNKSDLGEEEQLEGEKA